VLGVEAVDHFGDGIEPVKVNEIPKHLPAGMRSALTADIHDRECLFKKFIVHDPLGEKRIGVVIEFHPRTPRRQERQCATRLHELRFEELKGLLGSLNVGIDAALAKKLFPGFVADFGLAALAELLALTRLVGMRCPGRHSIFNKFDVTLDRSGVPGRLNFRVERTDERFLCVDMVIEGARLGGKLRAFFRPPPQAQPGIAEIAAFVGQHEFERSVSLVVGGSRGLGETTAKIIAAGGGLVVITYHRGAEDAARATDEIRRWRGRCESAQLNVLRPGSAIRQLFARHLPRTIYYFATPQIFARRRTFFSRSLFQTFLDYYVIGFSTLIDAAAEQTEGKLRIFCPSSVTVDESLREIAEYAMAKRATEDLCAFYNRFSDRVEIIVERLPRTKTDQTSTLVEIPAEDSVKVMLPIVRRVEANSEKC
jgi:hypothetical protein